LSKSVYHEYSFKCGLTSSISSGERSSNRARTGVRGVAGDEVSPSVHGLGSRV